MSKNPVGQPTKLSDDEDDGDAVVVTDAGSVPPLVGRTGGTAVTPVDDPVLLGRAGQPGEPHARSVGQQPPPRLAGQDWKPVVQVAATLAVGLEAEGVVVTEDGGVDTGGTAVTADDAEEEGGCAGVDVEDDFVALGWPVVTVARGSVVVVVTVVVATPENSISDAMIRRWDQYSQPTS
ncbi:MAG: hypothetical protein M1822_001382 [Bathelium mastoideum]|nr:MAG: hypothetical protein M1822_001382 [Bathelium mastoideum]